MYNVNLEVFQGPLDLLLHLIEKMEIDIHNIPIAKLTDSYLEYLNSVDEISLDNAEEYIVMASTLIHIKSKSLLPKDILVVEEEEYIEDDLIQQLIDYKNYKETAQILAELQKDRQQFGEKLSEDINIDAQLGNMPVKKLFNAFKRVLDTKFEEDVNIPHYTKEVSVEDIKKYIVKYITKKKKIIFSDLISNYDTKSEIVAAFICILDMIKENLLICQEIGEELYIEGV